jgi:hypothetical protein
LIFGFTSSRRARCALVTSPADSYFERTAEAISHAVICQMWLMTPLLVVCQKGSPGGSARPPWKVDSDVAQYLPAALKHYAKGNNATTAKIAPRGKAVI